MNTTIKTTIHTQSSIVENSASTVAVEAKAAMATQREAGTLRVGYIVRSFPRLSQTFVLNEVLALEADHVDVRIFSCTNPKERMVQPQVKDVRARIDYLEEGQQRPQWLILWEQILMFLVTPYRYLHALWHVARHPEFDKGYAAASRYNCFLQAVYLARMLHQERDGWAGIDHLHAHFAHDPTLIAQLVHLLTGIPYTFTAHARDIYQIPARALADRIHHAEAVVTCCALNVEYFKSIVGSEEYAKLQVIHNGINLADFQPSDAADASGAPPLILSASRLVEKKGYLDLLAACRCLRERGHTFRCVIYGEGPLYSQIAATIDELALADCVTLAGVCTQQELREVMPKAAIFALTPFVTEDGDRDGVPTVLAEAMACGVPVVSTTVAGIPELVADGHNGLLAGPHQIEEIADNLALLLTDETRRRRYGVAARETIVEAFNLQTGARQLATLYRGPLRTN